MTFNFRKFLGREEDDDFVEIDLDSAKPEESKIVVKPFVLKNFETHLSLVLQKRFLIVRRY